MPVIVEGYAGSTGAQGPAGPAGAAVKGLSATYLIYKDSGTGIYTALNGLTANIDYTNADAATLIAQAAGAIASGAGTLSFAPATYPIASNQTLACGIVAPRGVMFNQAAGVTLTLNSQPDAGPYQIFSGPGLAALGHGIEGRAEWWGADNTGTLDSAAAWNAAIVACSSIAMTPNSTYLVGSLVSLKSNLEIKGAGPTSTFKATAAMNTVLGLYTGTDVSLHDFKCDGQNYAFAEGFIRLEECTRGSVHQNTFANTAAGTGTALSVYLSGASSITPSEYIDVSDNKFTNAAGIGTGASGDTVKYVSVTGNQFDTPTTTPIGGQCQYFVYSGNILNGGSPIAAYLGNGIDCGTVNRPAYGVISHNVLYKATIYGQDIAGPLVIDGNMIDNEGAGIPGILFIAANVTTPGALIITNNKLNGCGSATTTPPYASIHVGRATDSYAGWNELIISDNVIDLSQTAGISVARCNYPIITDNQINDSSQAATNTYDGIVLDGTAIQGTIDRASIRGNTILDTATNKARYAVNLQAAVTLAYVETNTFAGQATAPVFNQATSVARIRNNRGLVSVTAAKTASYALQVWEEFVPFDGTGGAWTGTLPAASSVEIGTEFEIIKIDASANNIYLAAAGTDTINGAAYQTLSAQWAKVKVKSNVGQNGWYVV